MYNPSLIHENNKDFTVLTIDDDPIILESLCQAFGDIYRILIATNGADALGIARKQLPDLIILDVLMPDMNGYEVLQTLKNLPETKDIPVIFLTSKKNETDETSGFEQGVVDYWVKPISVPIAQARAKTHLELKYHRDRLAKQAMTDGLTGLMNRRAFDEILNREIKRSFRTDTDVSLLLIDVDYFKKFNDLYGHQAGDDCLKNIANTIHSCLDRGSDVSARFGGEEFACILPETDLKGAELIARKIQQTVESLNLSNENSLITRNVTVSVGGASLKKAGSRDAENLINCADHALYKAKEEGRNRLCI